MLCVACSAPRKSKVELISGLEANSGLEYLLIRLFEYRSSWTRYLRRLNSSRYRRGCHNSGEKSSRRKIVIVTSSRVGACTGDPGTGLVGWETWKNQVEREMEKPLLKALSAPLHSILWSSFLDSRHLESDLSSLTEKREVSSAPVVKQGLVNLSTCFYIW